MPAHDETTVTVEHLETGELMTFTVKTDSEATRWTTAAQAAAMAHWDTHENAVSIKSWQHGDPTRHRPNQPEEDQAEQPVTLRYIDMTPTWTEAAQIIAAVLEDGTATGRQAARAELFRMAAILDELKRAEAEERPDPTALPEPPDEGFTVAAYHENGSEVAQMHTEPVTIWQNSPTTADRISKELAERLADDWTSHARSKGLATTYKATPAAPKEPQT